MVFILFMKDWKWIENLDFWVRINRFKKKNNPTNPKMKPVVELKEKKKKDLNLVEIKSPTTKDLSHHSVFSSPPIYKREEKGSMRRFYK